MDLIAERMAAMDANLTLDSEHSMQTSESEDVSKDHSSDNHKTYASFTPSATSLPKHTSPLLSSTPPTVTKALSQAYPFILVADNVLGLLTWTGGDMWQSFLVVAAWTSLVLYFEILVGYFGHLLVVACLAGYVWFNREMLKRQVEQPTLDNIVHTLTNVVTRLNLLMLPLTSLQLTSHDVTRLIFTTLFLSPVYIIVSYFILTPRSIFLFGGVFVLTYHSVWARVTRAVLWRSRTVRLLCFYLTGLDFTGSRKNNSSGVQLAKKGSDSFGIQSKSGRPVRFTYVLFENQRKWLGVGWTANLLAYERCPWTDEFLNESNPPETFKLPDAEGTNMEWRWVDKTWKVDLSNDGALAVNSKSKNTPDPSVNDGYIYYDNTWKRPSTEDSYMKYTRRRRWVRTAELITLGQYTEEETTMLVAEKEEEKTETTSSSKPRQRKSLRFESDDKE